jgi:hypothetical protein
MTGFTEILDEPQLLPAGGQLFPHLGGGRGQLKGLTPFRLEAMPDGAAARVIWTLPGLAQCLRRERGVVLDFPWLSVLLPSDGPAVPAAS